MAGFRDQNVLFCYHGHARFYDAPPISDRMTICGPFVTPNNSGPVRRIRSGFRDFDLADLIAGLPVEDRPDIVFIRVDASRSVLPTGLEKIAAPVIILAGDTHHMARPLQTVIEYLQEAAYDYLITYNNRHHAHFYIEAGLKNVFWAPGPTVTPFADPPAFDPAPEIVFVGGLGATHIRRHSNLNALDGSDLTLKAVKGYGDEAAALYTAHAGALNCSLNGDLNMRIFEVLSAGGCLITDRLPKFSGLDLILKEREHYLAYDSAEEMIEVCREVVEGPDLAQRIAANGKRVFDDELSLDHVMGRMAKLVLDGEADALTRIDDPRIGRARTNDPVPLQARLEVYEALQEAGLRESGALVYIDRGVPDDFISDLADLTQISIALDPAHLETSPDLPEIFAAHRDAPVEPLSPEDAAARDWGAVLTLSSGLEERILSGETPRAGLYLLCDPDPPALTYGATFLDELDMGPRVVRWLTPPAPDAAGEARETTAPARPEALAFSSLGLRNPDQPRFGDAKIYQAFNDETYGHLMLFGKSVGFSASFNDIIFKIQRIGETAGFEFRKVDLSDSLAAQWGPEDQTDQWGPFLRFGDNASPEDAAAARDRIDAFGEDLRAAAIASIRLAPALFDVALRAWRKEHHPDAESAATFRDVIARASAFAADHVLRGRDDE